MSMPRSARPTTVGELNTAGDETPIALSGDQCRLYFTSSTNRPRVAAKPPLP